MAIADTHLGFDTGKTSEARNYTYEQMFQVFESINNIAKEENVDFILHGGDLFNRSKPRKKVLRRTFDIIEQILKDDIGFLAVPGNHEQAKIPENLLNYHPKCHFFTSLSLQQIDCCNIIGFPYQAKNIDGLIQKIDDLIMKNREQRSIVLCHQLFSGSTFGPHQFMFKEQHGAININYFSSNICLFISGHIHRAQVLNDGLVVYPGSLERTSFVESIEPKGYLLIDVEEEYLKVRFKQISSSPMDVFEVNLLNNELDLDYLTSLVKPGLRRTLLRLIGRELTTEELSAISELFPPNLYPLLITSPRFPKQLVKPLYERCKPFEFPSYVRHIL